MRLPICLLLVMLALPAATPGKAQTLPGTVPDSTAQPASVSAGTTAATDVIVRTNGDELPARVLRITPQLVRYLAPLPTEPLEQAPGAAPDTLELAAADVFMIRYANGTRELLRPAPAPGTSLLGLSAAQRSEQGRQDSRRYYKPAKGVFWGTFAGTLAGYGIGGVVTGSAIALTPPPRHKLNAPDPALLNDPAYYDGYRQQAQNRKLGKAAAGFGVGLGAEILLFTLALIILLNSGLH